MFVNEFGDMQIDNDFFKVDGTDTDLIETSTGCICCEPGNDIESTLARLSCAIDDSEVRAVDRVVIETTGLADLAQIINQMLIASQCSIARRYFVLATVHCVARRRSSSASSRTSNWPLPDVSP